MTYSKGAMETVLANEKYVGDVIHDQTFPPAVPEKNKNNNR